MSIRQLIEALGKRVEQLEQELEKLQGEKQLLHEQGKRNSQNSSIPASQEQGLGFQPKPKTKSGKQRGGQPGHEGHDRRLYPSEACESVTDRGPRQQPKAFWEQNSMALSSVTVTVPTTGWMSHSGKFVGHT